MPELTSVEVVEISKLTDYLMTCEEDTWTKEGWDKVFEEIKTILSYAK